MDTKKVTIVKPAAGEGGNSDAYDLGIQPGMTSKQVMEQIGLAGDYNLARGDGQPIDPAADLYALVQPGEKLFATTAARVGLPRAA
jgi:hypothetical protein